MHTCVNVIIINMCMRPSWSYGSWVYNYLCNQCLSPLKLWVSNPSHGEVYSILC